MVGVGSGLGAAAFRYLIYFFTWLATGHAQFGQDGRVPSGHLPWLGLACYVVIPVIGGLLYGPLIYRWARAPENRLRIMVACGAAGGISATFNAPITGVFFGVEIILREFSVDALFTVMLSPAPTCCEPSPREPGRPGTRSRPCRAAQWPCFKVLRGIVTVLWRMMVLRGCRRTGGCRTGSRSVF